MSDSIAKRARTAAQLTQAQLAAMLGVARSTVARWEAGKAAPGPTAALLVLLAAHPDLVMRTLAEAGFRVPSGRAVAKEPALGDDAGPPLRDQPEDETCAWTSDAGRSPDPPSQ